MKLKDRPPIFARVAACVSLIARGVSDRRTQGLGLVTLGPCDCGGQLSFGRTFAQRVQWWVR